MILGLSAVRAEGDPELASDAADALAKITAALPEQARHLARHVGLRAARVDPKPKLAIDPGIVRRAMWDEQALDLDYQDGEGRKAARRNLPLSVVFSERSLIVLAFCTLSRIFGPFAPTASGVSL